MECYDFGVISKGTKRFLLIYDVSENKNRARLAKALEGYGTRVQKSAFEFEISTAKYDKLLGLIPRLIDNEDKVKIYHYSSDSVMIEWNADRNISGRCDMIIV